MPTDAETRFKDLENSVLELAALTEKLGEANARQSENLVSVIGKILDSLESLHKRICRLEGNPQ